MEEEEIPQFAARIKQKFPEYADVEDYELVEKTVRKFPSYASKVKLPTDFRLLTTSTGYKKLDDLYEQAGREENVDPNLLLEQGRQESINFNPDVVYGRRDSPKGARGLGQFMPGTAPTYGLTVNDKQDDRADPTKAVRAQARYMRKLLDQFNGDENLALAGYNAGEYRDSLKNGEIPNIKETQNYVKIIGGNLKKAREAKTKALREYYQNQAQISPNNPEIIENKPISTNRQKTILPTQPEIVNQPNIETPELSQPAYTEFVNKLPKNIAPPTFEDWQKNQQTQKTQIVSKAAIIKNEQQPQVSKYAKPDWKVTELTPEDESRFQTWAKQNNAPITDDYDMRGFWKGLQTGDQRATTAINSNDGKLHYPDTWKTPLHKSFSNESIYATPDAPSWNDKNQLVDNNGNIVFDENQPTNQVPPVPERSVTLEAQQNAMLDRKNGAAIAVLFTDGERVPDPSRTFIEEISTPSGVLHVSVPKLKTWWTKNNPKEEFNFQSVKADIESGKINVSDLIGGKANVTDDTSVENNPVSLVTTDTNGNELNASVINNTSEATTQSELDKQRFGNQTVNSQIVPTEEIVNSRNENRPLNLNQNSALTDAEQSDVDLLSQDRSVGNTQFGANFNAVEKPSITDAEIKAVLKFQKLPDTTENRKKVVDSLAEADKNNFGKVNVSANVNNPRGVGNQSSDAASLDIPPTAYQELPNQSKKQGVIKNDDDLLASQGGVVGVDLSQKPKNMSWKEFFDRTSLKALQGRFGYTDEQINDYVASGKSAWGKDDFTDEELAATQKKLNGRLFSLTVDRQAIADVMGGMNESIRADYKKQQEDADFELSSKQDPLKFDDSNTDALQETFETEDYKKRIQDANAISNRFDPNIDELNAQVRYDLTEDSKSFWNLSGETPTEKDILDEVMDRQKYQLKLKDKIDALKAGESYNDNSTINDLYGGQVGNVAKFGRFFGGITRPLVSLGIEFPYRGFREMSQAAEIESAAILKNTGTKGRVLSTISGLTYDLPMLIAGSKGIGALGKGVGFVKTGDALGNVVFFGLSSAAETAGTGASKTKVALSGAEGALTALTFEGGSKLGKTFGNLVKGEGGADKLARKLLGESVTIGTIGGGTYAVKKTFGASDDEAVDAAIVNSLFHFSNQIPGAISSMAGKVFRYWKDKRFTDVTVDGKGQIQKLKNPTPDQFVDAETMPEKDIIDMTLNKDGVYVAKGSGETKTQAKTEAKTANPEYEKFVNKPIIDAETESVPVRSDTRAKLGTSQSPKELAERNPLRAEQPDPKAVEKFSSDKRAQKINEVLSDGKPQSIESLEKLTRYSNENISNAIDTLYGSRVIEILPDNTVRKISGDVIKPESVNLYDKYSQPKTESPQTLTETKAPSPRKFKEPSIADDLNKFDVENKAQSGFIQTIDKIFERNEQRGVEAFKKEKAAKFKETLAGIETDVKKIGESEFDSALQTALDNKILPDFIEHLKTKDLTIDQKDQVNVWIDDNNLKNEKFPVGRDGRPIENINKIYSSLPQQKEQIKEPEKQVAKVIFAERPNLAAKLNVFTERGTKASIEPKIVDSSELLTSLDEGYPSKFQPRDRNRSASKAQISEIANKLNPEFLGDSPKASDGRPLVVPVEMPDGQTRYAVISGNGRTQGIRQAYSLENEGSKAYADFVKTKGETSAKQPVYVGILDPEQIKDFPEFARESNESATAQMSASEQAKSDADRLDASVLNLFVPSDDGTIHGAANRDFVRAFLDKTTSTSERSRFIDAEGKLNQEGVTRVKNAVFAKAFGGSDMGMATLARMSESTDSNIKNITNALLAKAGELSSFAEASKENRRFKELDIAPDFARAMEKYSELKESGISIDEYIQQGNLFGADTSPLQTRIMQVFDFYKRRSKSIRQIIDFYIQASEAVGDPKQQGLFGSAEVPSKESVFEGAVKFYEKNDTGETEQISLLDKDKGRENEPETRSTSNELTESKVEKAQKGHEEDQRLSDGPEIKEADKKRLNQLNETAFNSAQNTGKIVRVGDQEIKLSPEQAQRWETEVEKPLSEAKAEFDKTMESVKAMRTRGDSTGAGSRKENADRIYKTKAIQIAGVKREISGLLTPHEKQAKAQREKSNFIGKKVSVDGKNAVVVGNPFGKVKVKFENAEEKTFDSSKVKAPVTVSTNTVDSAAHEAALSPKNDLSEPSQAQKEAGNYKKGHVVINGLPISIENPAGSERSGVDPSGKKWSVTMHQHYGYIKRTIGADEENIDVFIKHGTPLDYDGKVFIIDQVNADGSFDEHKVMIGFSSKEDAQKSYLSNYTKGWKMGKMTEMSMDDFKKWTSEDQRDPVSGQTATEKPITTDPEKTREEKTEKEKVNSIDKSETAPKKPMSDIFREQLAKRRAAETETIPVATDSEMQFSKTGRNDAINLEKLYNKDGEIDYEQVKSITGGIVSGESRIVRLNEREEQGRLLGGRRNVEASIICGSDARANRAESRGSETSQRERIESKARLEAQLEKYAKRENVWFDYDDFVKNHEYFTEGEEALIYKDANSNFVLKIVNYGKFDPNYSPSEFIDERISLFNFLFPQTNYELVGFTRDNTGQFQFILKQPYIDGEPVSKSARIAFMKRILGNDSELTSEQFANKDYHVSDLHFDNLLQDKNGNIFVIDALTELTPKRLGGVREYQEFGVEETPLDKIHFTRPERNSGTEIQQDRFGGTSELAEQPHRDQSNLIESESYLKQEEWLGGTINKYLNATVTNLSKSAKVEIDKSNQLIKLNPAAGMLLRYAIGEAQGKDPGTFFGVYLFSHPLHDVLRELNTFQTKVKAKGEDFAAWKLGELIKTFEKTLDPFHQDLAIIISDPKAPMVEKLATQEELLHRADFRVRDFKRNTLAPYQNVEGYQKAVENVRKIYEDANEYSLHNEVIAKANRDDASNELGISNDEIKEIRKIYYKQLINQGVTEKEFKQEYKNISDQADESITEYERTFIRERQSDNVQNVPERSKSSGFASGGTGEIRGERVGRGDRLIDGRTEPNRTGILEKTGKGIEQIDFSDRLNFADKAFLQKNFSGDPLSLRAAEEIAFAKPYQSTTKLGKMIDKSVNVALEAVSIPKSLKSSFDLSAPLRQGAILTFSEPRLAWKAFKKQVSSMKEANFDKFKRDLDLHPKIELAESSNLYLSTLAGENITNREEAFMSKLVGDDEVFENKAGEKVRRALTLHVRASERAYVTYLDSLRMDTFDKLSTALHEYNLRNKIDDKIEDYQGLAHFINVATGRGSLGMLEDAAGALNVVFFSARYWASRVQLLNPLFYAKLPPFVRKQALKKMLIFAGATALIMALLKLAGGETDFDPDSPDFLKVRFSKWHFDFGAGEIQNIRYFARMLKSAYGRITGKPEKSFGESKEASITKSLLRSKLSPTIGSAINVYQGSNMVGEKSSAGKEGLSLISPMLVEDTVKVLQSEEGYKDLPKLLPSIFGIGVSNYEKKKK